MCVTGNVAINEDINLVCVAKIRLCHEIAAKTHWMLTCTTCVIVSELYTVGIKLLSFRPAVRGMRGRTSQHKVARSKLTYL